jgi:hypothetical protein
MRPGRAMINPWFKFFTGDWIKDTRRLKSEPKAAWIDLLAYMWENVPKGELFETDDHLAIMLGLDSLVSRTVIDELVRREFVTRLKICPECAPGPFDSEALKDAMSRSCHHLVTPLSRLVSRRMSRDVSRLIAQAERSKKLRESARLRKQQERTRKIHEKFAGRSQKSEVFKEKKEEKKEEKNDAADAAPASKPKFQKPTPEEVASYAAEIGFEVDGSAFCDFYEAKGWVIGRQPMKDWKAAIRNWKRRQGDRRQIAMDLQPERTRVIL